MMFTSGMGDLRFLPEFRFLFCWKILHFFSNSCLISSLQVFFSFIAPIPVTYILLLYGETFAVTDFIEKIFIFLYQ